MSNSERRKATRRRTLKGGKIILGRVSVFDCTVRNLSDTGALLKLPSTVGIPDEFEFKIANDDIHVIAKVRWRTETEIGVFFEKRLP
ncbi:PilZ domain-containing protein [Stappia sp. F7233]|uniref:PilZ domain-containing protein n=1 Tax=Stappia albiluteola TaxID=2758565 RepID=A0A839ACY5_9HYPH|nr:PilZ domain-containing protein [Stappia albiluteola]MBA5776834.1 PilZ domain-containing protein [Stappia albiluteola]